MKTKKQKIAHRLARKAATIILAMVDIAHEDANFIDGTEYSAHGGRDIEDLADAIQADGILPALDDMHKLAFEPSFEERVTKKMHREHKELIRALRALFG